MREVIGAYHACVAKTTAQFEGFVAQFLGDGALIFFGYPQAHEDDAERAVRAGLALIDAIAGVGPQAEPALQCRIGIATGIVVVGDSIGTGGGQEQAALGETPNVAARLQALAAPNTVVIAHNTRRLLGSLFEYNDLGPVDLKGFAAPVRAWQVRGHGPISTTRFEALHDVGLTPLVGREEEIALLVRLARQAEQGEGRVVLICGEPGIGKSRLLVTLEERLRDKSPAVLSYFCSPHSTDRAFAPVIEQFERVAGFEPRDAPDIRMGKLQSLLSRSSGEDDDTQLLAAFLSIPTGDRFAPLDLTPLRIKERILGMLLRRLEKLAHDRFVLILYEDVHWIDPSSRELLDTIVERAARLPVLLLTSFRPEFQPPWSGQAHVTTLTLNRLGSRDGVALVAALGGDDSLPESVVQEIIDRTDGVPLFVEEMTKSVLEAAGVGDRTRALSTAPISRLAVPASLHASLMARLDRLGTSAREVAQVGAVIGRNFSYELLAPVAQRTEAELLDALDRLTGAGLAFRRGTPPQASYQFKHALVRDAAYGSLLRGQRRLLHGRVVAVLEDKFGETVESDPTLLAQHCIEAGLTEASIGYGLKAARQAMARSAMSEATALLQRSLDLIPSLPEEASRQRNELDLQVALGQALLASRGYAAPEVGTSYARAGFLAEQIGRSDYLVAVLYGEWTFHLVRSELRLALQQAERMEQIGVAQESLALRLLGHDQHGVTRFFLGDFHAARALFNKCEGLKDPAHRAVYALLTSEDPHSVTQAYLALTLAHLGYIDQGRALMSEALEATRQLRHAHSLAFVLNWAAVMEVVIGSPHSAQLHAEELVALSTEQGFPLWAGSGNVCRGWSLTALGQAQEGFALANQGLSMVRATGGVLNAPWYLTRLAEAFAGLGQPARGLDCLAQAATVLEATDNRCNEAELLRLRGDLLDATGDRAAAEENYRLALVVAQRQSAKVFELRAALGLAQLWRNEGKRTEARDLLVPVYAWFTEGADTPHLQEAKALTEELA